jgi:putative sterol carrier protein
MSDILAGAVAALNARLAGGEIGGSVKFEIEDAGAVRIDEGGARIDDGDADCTLIASRDTFESLLAGDLDPTAAFMSGRLRVEGDMGLAMRLGALLK